MTEKPLWDFHPDNLMVEFFHRGRRYFGRVIQWENFPQPKAPGGPKLPDHRVEFIHSPGSAGYGYAVVKEQYDGVEGLRIYPANTEDA